jgi:hypothetical protein
MRRKDRQYFPFNAEEIASKIEKFNAFREGNRVSTQHQYGGITVEVSDQYRFFDFKSFALNVISMIAQQSEIFYYSLHIRRGIQEIDLLTNPTFIGDEVYYQSLSLLNSNDRSRALQFNAGLMRWKENHAFIVPVPNAATSERAIHKGASFEEKVKNINSFVDTLPTLMKSQMDIVKMFGSKTLSVQSIVQAMLAERKEGTTDITVSALNRTKAFLCKITQNMKPSEMVEAGLAFSDFHLLKKPIDLSKSSVEFNINLYDAFLWYTESYKGRDTSVINRESNRFFELIEKSKIEDIVDVAEFDTEDA